jgi:hypothetical protein
VCLRPGGRGSSIEAMACSAAISAGSHRPSTPRSRPRGRCASPGAEAQARQRPIAFSLTAGGSGTSASNAGGFIQSSAMVVAIAMADRAMLATTLLPSECRRVIRPSRLAAGCGRSATWRLVSHSTRQGLTPRGIPCYHMDLPINQCRLFQQGTDRSLVVIVWTNDQGACVNHTW